MNVNDNPSQLHLPVESRTPALAGATGWLNSEPLTSADLHGKVVLVQFGTFTCINWLRTLPYIRAWQEAYRDHGLVVVGVQTPEFSIEHDGGSVRRSMRDMHLGYPIAIDNDYLVWDAFANRYWPALYVADADGRIRHHHFGEGGYERTESVIRQLLADAGAVDLPNDPLPIDAGGIELPADWPRVKSPETYFGLGRSEGFASPEEVVFDESRGYTVPSRLRLNEWALGGNWTVGSEEAVNSEANALIAYQFHARDLNLILAPPKPPTAARFRVLLDGRAPEGAHGLDVDEEGNGVVTETRLYQLIRQNGRITDRLFQIELLDPGAAGLCFTFG
jgi:thiol-disulfide isomerase/thioredoxin